MEGMKHCQYTIDGLQCEYPFAHSGVHLVTVQDREVKWQYGDSERTEDLVRGYPACYQQIGWEQDIFTCTKEMGHEGNHEADGGYTFSDQDIEKWLSGGVDEEAQVATVPVTPNPKSPTVTMAMRERDAEDTSLIAVTRPNGGVDRHEIVGWHIIEKALYVITPTDDIVYAEGHWAGVRAEPRG